MTTGINSYNNIAGAGLSANQVRTPKSELGKDEFLMILSKQMSNQDPLEPVKDTDFIAQMAQFSALEQMQAMNAGFASMQAYSLLGKEVTAKIKDANGIESVISGKVSGIVNEGGQPKLVINENKVALENVKNVGDGEQKSSYDLIGDGAALIGKIIIASMANSEGTGMEDITGLVESVFMDKGSPYAIVGGASVPFEAIKAIGGK